MDPDLTSHGHSQSDPGVMSLSQASIHLREYLTRIEDTNSSERKAKRSNLSAAVTAFEISTFLAQHNRDLCRELSVNVEGPTLPFLLHSTTHAAFEARLKAAVSENFGASFVLHHRLLSYYLYSSRFADIIAHIEAYNRTEYSLTTNIEWTRWCEKFCSSLVERHFECRFGTCTVDLSDDLRNKYVALDDVNIFDLLILRLRLAGQRNTLETEFSTISEFSELCEAHSQAIQTTEGYMMEVFRDSFYAKREPEWTQWKAESSHSNFSQKWRSFLRLSAVAAEPSPLVQQAWDWLVQAFDHEDFMHLERWSVDSSFDSAPHFGESLSPVQLARITRYSEDCKFAHLLLSNTTASGKSKEASKKYAKYVLAVPPPSNLSANFFLNMAIKCDMTLIAHAREARDWSWMQNKLFFYFEFSRYHAIPMILDFLVHLRGPADRTYAVLPALLAFIVLQKSDDKRIALPWSSPLLPWVELIKQPFFDVTPTANVSDHRIWSALLDAVVTGIAPTQISLDQDLPSSGKADNSGVLSTPARKSRVSSILTPSRLGTPGASRGFVTPQRARFGLSQPSTPMATENTSSKTVLDLQKSSLPIDRNSSFAKLVKRFEAKILGSLASHDPSTITDISNTLNTLLSLLEWSASRYDIAKKSGLKIAPSSIASHVVVALNVDAFFVAIALPSACKVEQDALESASILLIDSVLQTSISERLPTAVYESLLRHTSTMQDNANAALLSAELWNLIAVREGEDSSSHRHLLSNLERAEKLRLAGKGDDSRPIFADFETRVSRLKSSAPRPAALHSSSNGSSSQSSTETPGKAPLKSFFSATAVSEPEAVKSSPSEDQLQQAFVSRLKRGLAKVTMKQQTPIQVDDFDLPYLSLFSSTTSVPSATLPSLAPTSSSIPTTPATVEKKSNPQNVASAQPVAFASTPSTPFGTSSTLGEKKTGFSAAASSPFAPKTFTPSAPFGAAATEEKKPATSFAPVTAKPFTAFGASSATEKKSESPASLAPSVPASVPAADVAVATPVALPSAEAMRAQMRAEMEAEIAKEKALLLAQREEFEREKKLFQLSKDTAKQDEEKKRVEYQRIVQEHQRKIAAEAEELERRALDQDNGDDENDSDSESDSSSSDDGGAKVVKEVPQMNPSIPAKSDEPPRRTSPRAHPLVPKMMFNTALPAGKTYSFGTKTSPTGSAQTSPTTPTSANSSSIPGSAASGAQSADSSPNSTGTADSSSSTNSASKAWAPLAKSAFSFGTKSTASTTPSPAFLGSKKTDEPTTEAKTEENSIVAAPKPATTTTGFASSQAPKASFGFGTGAAFGSKSGFGAKPVASPSTSAQAPIADTTKAPVANTMTTTPSTTATAATPAATSQEKPSEAKPFSGFGSGGFGAFAKPETKPETKVETKSEIKADTEVEEKPEGTEVSPSAPATSVSPSQTDAADEKSDSPKSNDTTVPTTAEAVKAPVSAFGGFGKTSFGFGGATKFSFGAKPAASIAPASSLPISQPKAETSPKDTSEDKPVAEESPKETVSVTSSTITPPAETTSPVEPTPVVDLSTQGVTSTSEGETAEKLKEEQGEKETKSVETKSTFGFSASAQANKTQFSVGSTSSVGKSPFAWNPPTSAASTSSTSSTANSTSSTTPLTSETASQPKPAAPKFGGFSSSGFTAPRIATTPQFGATPSTTKTFGFGVGTSFTKPTTSAPSTPIKEDESLTPAAATPTEKVSSENKSPLLASLTSGFANPSSSSFGFKVPASAASSVSSTPQKDESSSESKDIVWREPNADDDDESWADDGEDEEESKPVASKPANQLSGLLKAAQIGDDDDFIDDRDEPSSPKKETPQPATSALQAALAGNAAFSDDEDDDFPVDDDQTSEPKSNGLLSALAAAGGFGDSDDEDFSVEDDDALEADNTSTKETEVKAKPNALQSALAAAGGFGDSDDEDFADEDASEDETSAEDQKSPLSAIAPGSKLKALQLALAESGDDFDVVSDDESDKNGSSSENESALTAALDSAGFGEDDEDF